MQPLRKELVQKVVRLGGQVTEGDQGFSHFVSLSKRCGGSFQKSIATLWALAKGMCTRLTLEVDIGQCLCTC